MHDLEIVQGDEKSYTLNFTAGDSALDITGATVVMSVKRSLSDEAVLITKTITSHSEPVQGKTVLTLDTTDTSNPIGKYYYDMQISSSSIPKKTFMRGLLNIVWQITES